MQFLHEKTGIKQNQQHVYYLLVGPLGISFVLARIEKKHARIGADFSINLNQARFGLILYRAALHLSIEKRGVVQVVLEKLHEDDHMDEGTYSERLAKIEAALDTALTLAPRNRGQRSVELYTRLNKLKKEVETSGEELDDMSRVARRLYHEGFGVE